MRHVPWIVIVLSITFFNCSSSLQIKQGLTRQQYSMGYILDSKPSETKTPVSVFFKNVAYSRPFPDTVDVHCKAGFVLPLIVLNVWGFTYKCTLGKQALTDDVNDFLINHLKLESQRSGIFSLAAHDSSADYSVRLDSVTIICDGPYTESGMVMITPMFFSFISSNRAGPCHARIAWTLKIFKNNLPVSVQKIETEQEGHPISSRVNNIFRLQNQYGISMAEGLSFAYKQAIESTVEAINEAIRKNK